MEVEEIRTARVRHEVLRAGEGRPLLLLHGLTAVKEAWSALVDPLAARGWEVVAPDQRGHGRSEWPESVAAYTLDALVDDAWAIVDHLGWDDVVVVGHSLGGVVAQLMALGAPDRVAGLGLVATIPGRLPGDRPSRARVLAGRLKRSGLGLVGGRRPAPADPGEDAASSPSMVEGLLSAMAAAPDRGPGLRSVRVPALVVGGADDHLFIPGSYALADALPGARLVVLDGVGHEVPTEATDRLRREVITFLDDLPASRT